MKGQGIKTAPKCNKYQFKCKKPLIALELVWDIAMNCTFFWSNSKQAHSIHIM